VTKYCLLPSPLSRFVVPDNDSIDDSLSRAQELLETYQTVSRGARKCLAVLRDMESEKQKEHGNAREGVIGGASDGNTSNEMWERADRDMLSASFEFLMQSADWDPSGNVEDDVYGLFS
jgi:hypothetical protein